MFFWVFDTNWAKNNKNIKFHILGEKTTRSRKQGSPLNKSKKIANHFKDLRNFPN